MRAAVLGFWLGSALVSAATAQPAPAASPPPATAPVPAPTTPPPPVTADVSGFRSARFGMSEAQVLEAIKADFNVDDKDAKRGANDQEKTKYIAIQVPNLVPDSGLALVTYIFGYRSHKLIQVNVVWGRTADRNQPGAELVTTGRLLQQYFVGQGFARDTLVVNRATKAGSIILFNGFDDKKRSVMLILDTVAVPVKDDTPPAPPAKGKPPAKGTGGKAGDKKSPPAMQLVASGLRLSYIENVASPDIFRIQRGKF
jgi:hypothetical protein